MIEIPLSDLKKSMLDEKQKTTLNYRYNASLLQSFYFGWIFPLIQYARKQTLSIDVLQPLSKDQKSESVYYRWNDHWKQQKQTNSKDPLFQSIKSTFKRQFILGFLCCFLSYTSTMVAPIIIYFLTNYLIFGPSSAGTDVLYLIVLPLIRFVRSLFNGHSIFRLEMIGTQISNSLSIGMVNKAMSYSVLCNKSFKLGQITGLMQVDCLRLSTFPRSLTELIVYCYCLIFGIVFLIIITTYSAMSGLGVCILIVLFNIQISKKIRNCLKQFSKATDERMKVTNQVFNNIKYIKVNAYQQTFYDRLMQKRQAEIDCLKNKRKFDAMSTYVMWLTPKIIQALTFILYVYTGNQLSPAVTFSVLSLYGYLQFYLQNLPNAINNTIQAFNSLTRVQNFLLAEQINQSCITYNNTTSNKKDNNSYSITVENGSFYWDKQNQKNDGINPILNLTDLNFSIKQGQMVAIIGGVGAGKSSLLYALLGQMKFKQSLRPKVTVNGSLSLVTQKPWIINDTVRNNIVFGQRFDPLKYKEIIKYACLQRDFELFTHGDQTMIGEKGATLSGGQKARISFARALYSNSDILFLDDLLSAVDVHVGKFMMTQSLLKFTKNKTRILVTHALYYLKYCDKVLMMQGGKIVEQGPYDVIKNSSRFQDMQDAMMKDQKKKRATTIKLPPLIVAQNQQVDEQEQREEQILRQANNVREQRGISAIDRAKLEQIVVRKSKMSALHKMKVEVKTTNRQSKKEIIEVKVQTKKVQANQNELMVAEQVSNTSVFKLYYSQIKYSGGWIFLIILFINQLIWMILNSVNNIWLTFWSSFYVQTTPSYSQDFWSVGFLLTGLVYALFAMFRVLLITTAAPKMSMFIHQSMISNLLFSSLNQFFDRVPLGRILNRLSKDLNSVDMNIPMFLNSTLAFMFLIGSFVITINLQGMYYIFLPILVLFFILNHILRMYYAKPAGDLVRLQSITKSPIVSCFSQILSGLSTIRSYKKQSMFMSKNCAKIDQNKKPTKDKKALDIWLILRLTVISFITTYTGVAYALFWPGDSSSPEATYNSASKASLLVLIIVGFDEFTYYFIANLGSLDTELQSIERCETFMNLDPQQGYVDYLQDRKTNKIKALQRRLNPDGWPDKGRIDFLNLKCRYRKNLDLVLKGLNFTITGGHKLGVVGRTGSGKSTIMLCLLRILEASEGQILIDGRDIGKMSLEELRSKITIILQDPCLFAGTVRQNLDPLNEFTDELLNKQIQLCGLKQTLDSKNGLDTAVTQNGENYSAGERQLFSICRATLKPSKIVLIDEATANIDVQTEAIIYKAMNAGFRHSTVITVAHRLNTVINSDRILVLEGGLLKQYDNPQQLLKNPESFFAQLYNESLKQNKM